MLCFKCFEKGNQWVLSIRVICATRAIGIHSSNRWIPLISPSKTLKTNYLRIQLYHGIVWKIDQMNWALELKELKFSTLQTQFYEKRKISIYRNLMHSHENIQFSIFLRYFVSWVVEQLGCQSLEFCQKLHWFCCFKATDFINFWDKT